MVGGERVEVFVDGAVGLPAVGAEHRPGRAAQWGAVVLAAGPVAASLVIRSARGGVGAKLVGFAAFYLWMNLGMGVECAYLPLLPPAESACDPPPFPPFLHAPRHPDTCCPHA